MQDILNKIYNLEFIDYFHDYSDPFSNNRLYHWEKASLTKKFIEKNKNKIGTFLDAGSGRGPYTWLAKDNFSKIYSFEFSESELEEAKKNLGKNINIEFAKVDLTNIPLENEAIDVGVCSEVLEHIPDFMKAAKELYRVMRPGGKILLSMPNNKSLFYLAVKKASREISLIPKDKRTHEQWEFMRHQEFSYKDIEKIAVETGFEILSRNSVNILPLPYGLRKLLMKRLSFLFRVYIFIDSILCKIFPRFGSFYFLELKK